MTSVAFLSRNPAPTREQIRDAFDDYQRTQFGGWPWPDDDPVHGTEPVRFAQHGTGAREHPPVSA